MVALRKMNQVEFDAFLAYDIPAYANEKVRAGNWTLDEALARSREDHDRLLPHGLNTPYHHFFVIEVDGRPVGRIWLSSDPSTAGGAGFVYDLFVDEAFRRRGIAQEAMLLLEDEAARLGLSSLALHVFGYNLPARALYEKLGYEVTNLNLAKAIKPKTP